MLTPEQLQKIADTMFPMLDALNARILRDMIKRLAARIGRGEANMLTATDEWQAQVYQESGGLLEDVQREIQQFLQVADDEMARIFEDAAIKSLDADNRIYVQAGDKARPLSPAMLRVLTDTYQRTKGTVHNFTRTTATETQKEFIRLLDEAHLRVMSGAGAYTQAVSDAMRELSETQTRVLYPSGHVDTIEVAVLRAVRTGTAQAAGNMSLTDMEERGWDLIRVSAHIGARYGDGGENPGNHFWWQGKLYSKSGQDKRYPPFIATTGYGTGEGLCGWNCRHSFGPGDPNHNPYKDFDAEENKRVYDLSQKQREMERSVRHTKTKLIALREGIDATEDAGVKASLETEYAKTAKLLERQNEAYNKFCDDNNLKRLAERIEVAKWTRADAKKSMMATEETNAPKGSTSRQVVQNILLQSQTDKSIMSLSEDERAFSNLMSQQEGIVPKYTSYMSVIAKAFMNGTDIAKKVFAKYAPANSITDFDCHDNEEYGFNYKTQEIKLNALFDMKNPRGAGVDFFHEYGHCVDFRLCPGAGKEDFASLKSSSFTQSLKKDIDALLQGKKVSEVITDETALDAIAKELFKNWKPLHSVSDILSGFTFLNYQYAIRWPFRHEKAYWHEWGIERDAFAHMFQSQFFPEQRVAMQQYFPNAYKEFERILQEAAK